MRRPLPAKMALAMAGATAGTPSSPAPPGAALLATSSTEISGMSPSLGRPNSRSRKFVWDALANTTEEGKKVMCMSYYAKEAYPIYRKYSTKAIQHTINTYSKYTIPFPYPTAISVEAANGMEYPMICFNPGRAEPDRPGNRPLGARPEECANRA